MDMWNTLEIADILLLSWLIAVSLHVHRKVIYLYEIFEKFDMVLYLASRLARCVLYSM